MDRRLIVVPLAMFAVGCEEASPPGTIALDYPQAATVNHVDVYHGTEVADPYRWLEDDVRVSEDVRIWVEDQNDVTFAYLATIPERQAIAERITELWDYERYRLPRKEGGRYFYTYNDGLQNQDVLLTQATLDGEPELLLDPIPNRYTADSSRDRKEVLCG